MLSSKMSYIYNFIKKKKETTKRKTLSDNNQITEQRNNQRIKWD